MKAEYRIIDYWGHWYLERLKSPGIWTILGDYKSKEEAELALSKEENETAVRA